MKTRKVGVSFNMSQGIEARVYFNAEDGVLSAFFYSKGKEWQELYVGKSQSTSLLMTERSIGDSPWTWLTLSSNR